MKITKTLLAALPFFAVPLLAQPQIGGGTCSSATLSGTYSLTLTGRDVNASAVIFPPFNSASAPRPSTVSTK